MFINVLDHMLLCALEGSVLCHDWEPTPTARTRYADSREHDGPHTISTVADAASRQPSLLSRNRVKWSPADSWNPFPLLAIG